MIFVITVLFVFSMEVTAETGATAMPATYLAILDEIQPGAGVSAIVPLSRYFASLEGTAFDTPVFFLEGKNPGAVVLVVGGTHENEIAGSLAAIYLIEHCFVDSGTLIVVPRANASGANWTEGESSPRRLVLSLRDGSIRLFRYGSRLSNPADEPKPDGASFVPPCAPASYPELDGRERRNLDREYPGTPDGCMTSRLAFAIMRLITERKVDVAFDLHEAGPKSGLARSVIANPKNVEPAALAILDLEDMALRFKLDQSSASNAGYSHREWGDRTNAMAFLVETFNPAQTDDSALVDQERNTTSPLRQRVAEHLAVIKSIMDECAPFLGSKKPFTLDGLPDFSRTEDGWIQDYR
jgi:predicted deacylase